MARLPNAELFSAEIEVVDRILIRIVVAVRRAPQDRIWAQESSQRRHIAANAHLDHAGGQFGSPLFAAKPAEASWP